MNKDKKWAKEQLEYYIKAVGNPFNNRTYTMINAYKNVEHIINQLDEPEKIVIPRFVADWWERDDDSVQLYRGLQVKKKHKFDLVSSFHNLGLDDYLLRVEDWVDENDSAFLDLVNGKPYEVEKEKLYYIKFSENQYAQKFDGTKIDSMLINDKSIAGKFTKDDIEKMNPKLMAFAVEVSE